MNYLLHGDNIVQSRQKLTQIIKDNKLKGTKEVINLNGKTITETDLKQALETQSLFGGNRLVIIENLLSRQRSKEKNQLVKYLSKASSLSQVSASPAGRSISNLVLWEAKEVSQANLKKFKSLQTQVFKTPKILFKFLDSFKPQNAPSCISLMHQTIKQAAPELIFYMLSRRVSNLIIAQDQNAEKLLSGAPWQKGKLKIQAKMFAQNQLNKIHTKLLEIDQSIKTGQSLLDLTAQLELLLAVI